MRRIIIGAALAAAGTAQAQSSVTIFGTLDATVSIGRGSISNRISLRNSGYASSLIGLRGVEDLGGGMAASFWMEAAVAPDDGTGGTTNTNNQPSGAGAGGGGLTFNRRSTVSLNGNWGEVRLGRDYVAHYWNHVVFDPFRNKGIGTSATIGGSLAGVTSTRASNVIGYLTAKDLGGFYGQAQHFLGENASNAANAGAGTGNSIRVGYETPVWNAAVAAGRVSQAAGDVTTVNAGASVRLGDWSVIGDYNRDRVAGGATGKGWLIGTEVTFGVNAVRASYSTARISKPSARASLLALGYSHNLSKRTTLYTTVAQVRNRDGAAFALNGSTTGAGKKSSGLDLGIAHRF